MMPDATVLRADSAAIGACLRRVALVVAAVVLLWLGYAGSWRPHRITGDSMAPNLLGEHLLLTCEDCGIQFVCSVSPAPADGAVCPNCGARQTGAAGGLWQAGQRVRVDRLVFAVRQPRRWELAAYQSGQQRQVKRIAGLPTERLTIANGNLHANGRLVRKSLSQLRQVAVLVHDSQFAPRRPDLPSRWQSDGAWQCQSGPGQFAIGGDGSGWLVYHHRPCYDGRRPRTAESAIDDHYGFNQMLSRPLNPVNELMLECQLSVAGRGRLRVRAATGSSQWDLAWDCERGRLRLTRDGVLLTETACPVPGGEFPLTAAVFDGQFVAEVAGRVRLQYQGAETAAGGSPTPWMLSAEQLAVRCRGLRVWRDLHYLPPAPTGPWRCELGDKEFLLLGDNVPVSWDSRQTGPTPRKSLLGKVLID